MPSGSTLRLAFGAVRGVVADPTVRWLFLVYGVVFVGRQMAAQYLSLLVHTVEGTPLGVEGSIGVVLGIAAIIGAALSPIGGWIADRVGFRPVLVVAIAGSAVAYLALPLSPGVAGLALAFSLASALQAVIGAMVSGLLASEVPAERRSATLNLIYLPLYLGGISGPALGAVVVGAGLRTVFYLSSAILALAVILAVAYARRVVSSLAFGEEPGQDAAGPAA